MTRATTIYAAEREAGLTEALSAPGRLLLTAAAQPWALPSDLAERATSCLRGRARASASDADLYPLKAVLVSAGLSTPATDGWNLNDDVFLVGETWPARRTPADKPFNREHDCARIVGHILTSWGMGPDGQSLADDLSEDDLPAALSLGIGAVLYKVWEKPELQEEMDAAFADIEAGKLAVSMECLFDTFDYALYDQASGKMRVVARSRATAFMTKHLRAYGGDGTYRGERVGRVLRRLTFSGVGLVANPANPASVILSAGTSRAEIHTPEPIRVYSPLPAAAGAARSEPMAEPTTTTQAADKELADTKAALAGLTTRTEQAEKAKAAAEAALADKTKAHDELAAKLAAAEKAAEGLKTELSSANEKLAKLNDELEKKRAESRLAAAKSKLGLDDEKAAKFVEATRPLCDEAFASQLELVAGSVVTNNPQSGNAPSNHGVTVQTPPKSTPAATPPKSTPAAQAAQASADLAAATAEPPVSTVPPAAGVSDLYKAIAEFILPGEDDTPAGE